MQHRDSQRKKVITSAVMRCGCSSGVTRPATGRDAELDSWAQPPKESRPQASGVTQWWIGKATLEDLTWPVADMRAAVQEVKPR